VELKNATLKTFKEISQQLEISENTLKLWFKSDNPPPSVRFSSITRIDPKSFFEFFDAADVEYISPRSVADAFKITPTAVRLWCNSGKLKKVQFMGSVRIPKSDFSKILTSRA
tara:strand:- start:987 stop:1325 length:339 start_codon:yes stop_codon:yes gene_type:complete